MKVSIVTVVRNAESLIERTMRSVAQQSYANIQYVVIDGASSDATLERIQALSASVDTLISEPDSGISDAWNKGLERCTGEVIGLLNAGDEYAPDAVANAAAAVRAGAEFIFGDVELVDEDGRLLRRVVGRFSLWKYSAGFGFYHPSCFATRALYKRMGGFNTRYRRAMDSDWIARAVQAGVQPRHAPVRARMLDGGVSVSGRFLAYGEHLQALHEAGVPPRLVYAGMAMTGLRGLARAAVNAMRS